MTWLVAMATSVPGDTGFKLQKQSKLRRLAGEKLPKEPLSPTTVVVVAVFA